MKEGNAKICTVSSTMVARAMANDPQVMCSKCGVRAHDAANVCFPVTLESGK